MHILIPVIFFALILFFPLKLELKLHLKLKESEIKFIAREGFENLVAIYCFKIIPVFKKSLFSNEEKRKEKKKQDKAKNKIYRLLLKSVSFQTFVFSLGFNSYNPVINSYINAFINSFICIYININQKKFSLNRTYYQVYTSSEPLVIDLDISVKIAPIKIVFEWVKNIFSTKKNKGIMNKLAGVCK